LKDWIVAPGPASLDISANLSAILGSRLVDVSVTEFPDGETKIRVGDDLRGKNVIVVQSTYPPVDKHLMQLLLMAHKMSEIGAEVNAVIPYLCYARQDKEFLPGEVISLGVVSHLLRSVGVRRVVTVDIHNVHGIGYFSFPLYSVSAIPPLAEYVANNFGLSNPIAVSPDLGSSARVEAFAAVLKSEYVSLKKTRDRVTGEVATEDKALSLSGRDAVIVDDLISTGSSVAKAAQLLKKDGAGKVLVAFTHALLLGGAVEKMKAAGVDEIIATNTIPSKYGKVDVSALIASYFKTI